MQHEILKLWNTPCSTGIGDGKDDFQPYLERWTIDDGVKRGAVVVLPGGGYSHRADHEGGVIAQTFNRLGFHAFVVQYRVAPYRFPAPQLDAFRAIRMIRSHAEQWNVVPDKIAILGFSAGGHLAASAGTLWKELDAVAGDAADGCSQRPDAMVLCYAVINLSKPFGHNGSGKNLFGGEYDAKAAQYDLENQVADDTPPAFLWCTADDGCVNVRNSTVMAEALWSRSIPASLHVYPHGSHGLGLASNLPDVATWPELARDFLCRSCAFPVAK